MTCQLRFTSDTTLALLYVPTIVIAFIFLTRSLQSLLPIIFRRSGALVLGKLRLANQRNRWRLWHLGLAEFDAAFAVGPFVLLWAGLIHAVELGKFQPCFLVDGHLSIIPPISLPLLLLVELVGFFALFVWAMGKFIWIQQEKPRERRAWSITAVALFLSVLFAPFLAEHEVRIHYHYVANEYFPTVIDYSKQAAGTLTEWVRSIREF
jgi:hypothetical protein